MSNILSKQQVISALYDFEADPSEGAVGTILLGVIIPKNALSLQLTCVVLDDFTSGGEGSTLSFGYSPVGSEDPDDVDKFLAATAIASINAAEGFDEDQFFKNSDFAYELVMAIGTAALTAGKVQVTMRYYEYNF